jgi:ABC-type polysaccharide/polyol phosphate transport system ATPase subunit
MASILDFHNVSKRYVLGQFGGGLRSAIPNLVRGLLGRKPADFRTELWALKEVNFSVGPGEAVALIGPNGAGKTTALKLATYVTYPTSGQVRIVGRTSALIELGAGFHPDLTGRENIYLNGTILGMKRYEVQRRFDEIVAFSELERFLDTPVKRYSSGMYARLGFSVAAHVSPDILIVDEVLAVGDVAFQTKCLARMADMKKQGTTVIIVSHALPRLRRLCERAILLYRGQIITDGPVDEVLATYQNTPEYASNLKDPASESSGANTRPGPGADSPATITGVTYLDRDLAPIDITSPGERLVVRINYLATQRIDSPIFEMWLHSDDGTLQASHTTDWDGYRCDHIDGQGCIDLVVDPVCLASGRYLLSVALTASDGLTRYDWQWQRYGLTVRADRYTYGTMYLPHRWDLNNGQQTPAEGV